jgi:hypothetical protein
MNECIVKITEHKNYLIFDSDPEVKNEDWVPYGGSKIGCVIINTGTHLGISPQAAEILKQVKRSRDDIGEVDAWKTEDGRDCFAWLGPCKHIKYADNLDGSRCYSFGEIKYVSIPNEPPISSTCPKQ